jgi:hypothetical protein
VLELVADEPEVVLGLEVVAGGCLTGDGCRAREEVRAGVLERGPGRDDPGAEVEGADERYKARAAESSSSKSGTSAVS